MSGRRPQGPGEWERMDTAVVGDFEVFRVHRTRARSPRTGRTGTFHTVSLRDSVVVVAFTGDGAVLLVEQFRHGTGALSLELPGGLLEPGESPLEAAARELEEETGWRAGHVAAAGRLRTDPAVLDNRVWVVRADGCTPTGLEAPDETEDVRVHVAAPDRVAALIRDGRIDHALAIAAWALVASAVDGPTAAGPE